MLENELDASNFLFSNQVYIHEFENILTKIATCYLILRKDNTKVPLNDENGIRDILVNKYLNNTIIKRKIGLDYFILSEVPESNSSGRPDIRFFSPNTFYNQAEYYTIECKRLDNQARRGTSGLNYEYVQNGIQRFTSGFYSSYYKTNAMIGFIVEPMDIKNNIKDINFLLENHFPQIITKEIIKRENFITELEFHYSSTHITSDNQDLKLYHLMFSFC